MDLFLLFSIFFLGVIHCSTPPPTPLRTVLHLIPNGLPLLPPRKRTPADRAHFRRKRLGGTHVFLYEPKTSIRTYPIFPRGQVR